MAVERGRVQGSGGLCRGPRWGWLFFLAAGGRLLQRSGVALVDERQRLHQLRVQLRLHTERWMGHDDERWDESDDEMDDDDGGVMMLPMVMLLLTSMHCW